MAPSDGNGGTLDKHNLVHIGLMRAQTLAQMRSQANKKRQVHFIRGRIEADKFATPLRTVDELRNEANQEQQDLNKSGLVRDAVNSAYAGNIQLIQSINDVLGEMVSNGESQQQRHQLQHFRRKLLIAINGTMYFQSRDDLDGLDALKAGYSINSTTVAVLRPSQFLTLEELRTFLTYEPGQTSWTLDEVFTQLRSTKQTLDRSLNGDKLNKAEIGRLKATIKTRDDTEVKSRANIEQLKTTASNLQKRIRALELEKQGMVTRSYHDDEMKALREEIAQVRTKFEEKQADANSWHKQEITKIKEEMNNQRRDEITRKDQEISRKHEEMEALKTKLRSAEETSHDRQLDIQRLQGDLNVARASVEGRKDGAVAALQESLRQQSESLTKSEQRWKQAKSEADAANTEKEKETLARQTCQSQKEELKEELATEKENHRNKVDKLETELHEKEVLMTELQLESSELANLKEVRLPELTRKIDGLETTKRELETQIAIADGQVVQLKREKSELHDRIAAEEIEHSKTKLELTDKTNEMEAKAASYQELERSICSLESQKKTLSESSKRWKRHALEITGHLASIIPGIRPKQDTATILETILSTTSYVPPPKDAYVFTLDQNGVTNWDITQFEPDEIARLGSDASQMTQLWLATCCADDSVNVLALVEALIVQTRLSNTLADGWIVKLVAAARTVTQYRQPDQSDCANQLALLSLRILELIIRLHCNLPHSWLKDWYEIICSKIDSTQWNDPLLSGMFKWVQRSIYNPTKLASLPEIMSNFEAFERMETCRLTDIPAECDPRVFTRSMLTGQEYVVVVDRALRLIAEYDIANIGYRFKPFPACFNHFRFGYIRRRPFSLETYLQPDFQTHDEARVRRWLLAHKPDEAQPRHLPPFTSQE